MTWGINRNMLMFNENFLPNRSFKVSLKDIMLSELKYTENGPP